MIFATTNLQVIWAVAGCSTPKLHVFDMVGITIIQQTHIHTQYTYFSASVYFFGKNSKCWKNVAKHSFWEKPPSSWVEHTAVSQIVLTSLILVFETSTRNKQDFPIFGLRCPVVQKWSLGKAKKTDSAKQSRGKRINFQITRLFYISFLLKRCRSLSMRDLKVSKGNVSLYLWTASNCCLHHSLSIPTKWGVFFELRNCGTRDCICQTWHSAFRGIFCW